MISVAGSAPERLEKHRAFAVGELTLAFFLAALDTLLIFALAVVSGAGYHVVVYGAPGAIGNYATVGLLVAIPYVVAHAFAGQYGLNTFLTRIRPLEQTFLIWHFALICLVIIAFLTKSTELLSRGFLVCFYVLGLAGLLTFRVSTGTMFSRHILSSLLAPRRLLLVGTPALLASFSSRDLATRPNLQVVGSCDLPDMATVPADTKSCDRGCADTRDALVRAARKADELHVDSVVLLLDWSQAAMIRSSIETFRELPFTVYLGATSLTSTFTDANSVRIGNKLAFRVVRPPLTELQLATKRVFDVAVASIALLLLAPLFVVIALLIAADSPGPVLFLQRRKGFNRHDFRIVKFRTMTTMDDGDFIAQARRGDPRVTRVGRILRRYNIDELPQLWNVLMGEMSIVGPRPHATSHSREFMGRIANYARRHNVKPGITGWAQINGYRGPTDTIEALRGRIDHDLHYIDNWSFTLDIYIIAMTALSFRSYKNAF